MNNILGIDLGTTNSCAVFWNNNSANIVIDKFNNKTIPSIVAFNKNGRLSGYDAKSQIEKNPKNTIYDVKRLIGRKYSDPNIQNDLSYFTYNIESDENDDILITSKYSKKKYTPVEISSIILQKLKISLQNILILKLKMLLLQFLHILMIIKDKQQKYAEIAGLNCVRVLNEPTAAALAYGLNNTNDKNILVYDFGGGTLDVSLLNIDDGVFKVLATTGDTHLGGEDFDEVIYNYCIEYFKNVNSNIKINSKYYLKSLQKLRIASENCKVNLSYIKNYTIHIPNFYNDKKNNINLDLHIDISQELFEKLSIKLLERAIKPIENIMDITDLEIDEIDDIILVGGSSRIPRIKFNIHNFLIKNHIHLLILILL